ncbi:MAG: helix-turn-helix transcriptional regulator [Lentisphaeria bacterium]|nr:helix-turn-helix transcriptional regulator [Lentisphaeria bacterium]
MKSLSEICSTLPAGNILNGTGVSSMPPLIPERLNLYYRNGRDYKLWGRIFNHEYFIFVYMISGKRSVNINDCTYILEKGEFILIPPCAKHSFGGEFREFESLMASFVISGSSRRLLNIAAQSWRLTARERKTLRAVVGSFQKWLAGDFAAAEESVCHFAILLRQIQSIAAPELNQRKLSDAELPLLNRITAYLAANRHRHVTVAELSRELHVSGSTLRQTFRKKMNLSIGHYQLVRRLMHGIRLLRSTDLSVAEIAEKIGFSTANGFMLAIKRECHGATPKFFRKSGRN